MLPLVLNQGVFRMVSQPRMDSCSQTFLKMELEQQVSETFPV